MQNIRVKNIKPQLVQCYDPKGKSIGFLNEYQFLDLRAQIKNAKVDGYYCIFNGEKISIDSCGYVSKWPSGFFDTIENLLLKLL